jgi:hypothetical protein
VVSQAAPPGVMNIYDINPGQAVIKQTTLQIDLVENEDKNGASKK